MAGRRYIRSSYLRGIKEQDKEQQGKRISSRPSTVCPEQDASWQGRGQVADELYPSQAATNARLAKTRPMMRKARVLNLGVETTHRQEQLERRAEQ